jgi:hypothetical protein
MQCQTVKKHRSRSNPGFPVLDSVWSKFGQPKPRTSLPRECVLTSTPAHHFISLPRHGALCLSPFNAFHSPGVSDNHHYRWAKHLVCKSLSDTLKLLAAPSQQLMRCTSTGTSKVTRDHKYAVIPLTKSHNLLTFISPVCRLIAAGCVASKCGATKNPTLQDRGWLRGSTVC